MSTRNTMYDKDSGTEC